jgi:hypothetical protein
VIVNAAATSAAITFFMVTPSWRAAIVVARHDCRGVVLTRHAP